MKYLTKERIKEIRANPDKVNWRSLIFHNGLSCKMLDEFSDRIDWKVASWYQKLSENLIRKHADQVSWNYISRRQKLSEGFIREFAGQIDWVEINTSQKHINREILDQIRKEYELLKEVHTA